MDDRKYLNLEELIIWSDNPRHGLQVDGDKEFTEEEVINILIDVVGTEKMYNLIADIFASKKLMGNVNPVVVLTNSKYYVYDGNRRVSALKILRNPAIIENQSLQAKVIRLVNGEDVSFANKVFVYITDEAEALEIMDKTHSGEQQGVGMISWEPYQRDISLNRRSKTLQYPYAFNLSQALGFTIKSFNSIPYTDLDRLFGSKPLREYFSINETDEEYAKKSEYIIGMLIKYKEKEGFKSFSRQFNTSGSTANDAPVVAFCNWVKDQERNKKNFYFKTNAAEIFEDEQYSFDMLQLYIYDVQKREIAYDPKEVDDKYYSPNGIAATAVDNTEVGNWQAQINYKGEKHTETITVKKLLSPKIDFDSKKLFGQGNTIDLRKLMIRATDGHGCNKKDAVVISAVGQTNIIRDIFAADNPLRIYQIVYAFQDITGAPYSVTKEIRIVDKSNPLLAENKNAPLLSFNGTCNLINISEVVNKLISEINNLEFEANICIISTALRSLVELSFDELHTRGKLVFRSKGNLEKCIEEFKAYLLSGELTRLCSQYSKDMPSYNNEKNCVEQINSTFLASYLNLAAHKSITRIDVTKIAEIARKAISPILVYTSLILK